MTPFSVENFLGAVVQTNGLLWPEQLVAILFALGEIYLCVRPKFCIERLPALFLSVAGFGVGSIDYGIHFTPLN